MSSCECSICLSEITAGKYSMACQHSYHYRCITNWFLEQTDNEQKESCPYCRREASEDEALPRIDELSVDDESEDSESYDESEESESESEDETVDQPPSELLDMSHRLCDDLHSLEDFKREIQAKITDGTATETQQGILNRILAYEVDLKQTMQKILEMEDLQVWRLGAPSPAPAPATPEEVTEWWLPEDAPAPAEAHAVAAWRTKVDSLWPPVRRVFKPEDEEEWAQEEEEDVWQQDQKHNLSLFSLGNSSPSNSDDEPTIKIQLKGRPTVFI